MGSLTYTSNVLNNTLQLQSCILGQLLVQGKHWDTHSKDRGVGEEPPIDWVLLIGHPASQVSMITSNVIKYYKYLLCICFLLSDYRNSGNGECALFIFL